MIGWIGIKLLGKKPRTCLSEGINGLLKSSSFMTFIALILFFNVLNNGWDNFTFYCPKEYTTCSDDVERIANNRELLSAIEQELIRKKSSSLH